MSHGVIVASRYCEKGVNMTPTMEGFVPFIEADGDDYVVVIEAHPRETQRSTYKANLNGICADELCLVEDGVVTAIVKFEVGETGLNADGTGLNFSAYYPDGQARPELFENMTAFDVVRNYRSGKLTGLWWVATLGRVTQIDDMIQGWPGYGYIFATDRIAETRGLHEGVHLRPDTVYVRDEGNSSKRPVPSIENCVQIDEWPSGKGLLHIRTSEVDLSVSLQQAYDDGYRVIIRHWTSIQSNRFGIEL